MHAVLLSLLLVPGNDPYLPPVDGAAPVVSSADVIYGDAELGGAGCYGGHGCGQRRGRLRGSLLDRLGPMPQTCYQPRYGCYPGTARTIQRYPAFHGTYYRTPYNYRNLFDFPWHAGLHEPTSHFSYNVPPEASIDDADPGLPPLRPDVSSRRHPPTRARPVRW